jgi:hypothetical protein
MMINIELTVDVPNATDLENAIETVEAAVKAAGLRICFETNAEEDELWVR